MSGEEITPENNRVLTGQLRSTKKCSNWPNAALTECSAVRPDPSETRNISFTVPGVSSVSPPVPSSEDEEEQYELEKDRLVPSNRCNCWSSTSVFCSCLHWAGRSSFRPDLITRALDQRFSWALLLPSLPGFGPASHWVAGLPVVVGLGSDGIMFLPIPLWMWRFHFHTREYFTRALIRSVKRNELTDLGVK